MADTVFFVAMSLLCLLSHVAPLQGKATGSQPQAPCPSPQRESCKVCIISEAVKPRPKWPVGQRNSLRLPSQPLLPEQYPLFVWSRKCKDLFSILIPPPLSLPNLLLLLLFSFWYVLILEHGQIISFIRMAVTKFGSLDPTELWIKWSWTSHQQPTRRLHSWYPFLSCLWNTNVSFRNSFSGLTVWVGR